MDSKQAALFFPYEVNDDLDELWENRFFEQKQFFLTRPPIRKVWQARLKKLNKQYIAYQTLLGNQAKEGGSKQKEHHEHQFPTELISAFNVFHQLRTQHKLAIHQAQDIYELTLAIESWLKDEHTYASLWYCPESEESEIQVFISKEVDPVVFLEALKKVQKDKNLTTFEVLKKEYDNLPEILQKEVKRLTLLTKK